MVDRLLEGTCSHSACFQFFLSVSPTFVLQYLQPLTLLPFGSSPLVWWDDGKQGISRCQPLSTKPLQELHNSHVRVTIIFVDSSVAYHSQYCIHWKTSPLLPELAFHNQPLKCKTCIILCLDVTHSTMDSTIPPDGMDTILQLHCGCSISHKGLHQVQFIHRTSLKSPWVMKNKVWVTPKNQFIFDVMVPSLNAVSIVFHAAD